MTNSMRQRTLLDMHGHIVITSFFVGVQPHDVEGFHQLLIQLVIVERAAHVAMREVSIVAHIVK